MGAVSTRGARRERRLAKRNSLLYGPRTALLSAQQGSGSATGGSLRYGPVPDAAISGWRNCFLLRFGPAPGSSMLRTGWGLSTAP